MKQPVINLYAGPGAGKSTMAAGVFFHLKSQGINCELVTEYAKELCWQGKLKDAKQEDILNVQADRLCVLAGQVDLIITDSPILLTNIYCDDEALHKHALTVYNTFDNHNFFVRRVKQFQQIGRDQTHEEAKVIDDKIKDLLDQVDRMYQIVEGDQLGCHEVTGHACSVLRKAR